MFQELAAFFSKYGGYVFAGTGVALSIFLTGIGSSRGTGLVGKAAAGIIAEEPEKFGKALILQLLPGSQGLYGFIVAFLIYIKMAGGLSTGQGFFLLLSALPVALAGYRSAIYQAEVSVAGLQILAKNPSHNTKGIILAAIIETYAILGLVGSIIMIFVIYGLTF